jgi:(2R)-ethylmalonyl-CoA mutase
MKNKVNSLKEQSQKEIERVEKMGGALEAIDYMKRALVYSHAERVRAIESGEIRIAGVNCFTETETSPLLESIDKSIQKVDHVIVKEQIERLRAFREKRNKKDVELALKALKNAAAGKNNIMPASINCAHAGVTTGEWTDTLRSVFGEYRAPTGTSIRIREDSEEIRDIRNDANEVRQKLGRPIKLFIGKPGLDGHSNGAEQIAVRARDVGMEVLYQGIRLTPEQIVSTVEQENVDVIGLSILSGSHNTLIPKILTRLKEKDLGEIPIVVGGIIPEDDARYLLKAGIRKVYTPKDFSLNGIMRDIIEIVKGSRQLY